MKSPPLGRWLGEAVRDLGWRDALCMLAVGLFPLFFGPHGGGLFVVFRDVGPTGVDPLFDPAKNFGRSVALDVLSIGVPLVFAVKVANRAIADRVPRWLAYTAALLATGAVRHVFIVFAILRNTSQPMFPAEIAWYYTAILLQGGIGLVIYARWRAAKESMRLVQANETQRARTAQRLQSARLLALQARVDPQLLFDSLGRVGILQRSDAPAAEALLGDLITLLRAMLPGETALTSTVAREFAVIDAWLQVTGGVATARADVVLHAAADAVECRIAPLLCLPLLRAALDVPGGRAVRWRLEAVGAGGRLLITLRSARADGAVAGVLARADVAPLRERLASLHGEAAKLWVAQSATSVTLDLPFSLDDDDTLGQTTEDAQEKARDGVAQDSAA